LKGTYNRCVKIDYKLPTVCEKCQKTAGGGGFFVLTFTVYALYIVDLHH